MKRKIRRGAIVLLSVVFAVSSAYSIKVAIDYRKEAEIYAEAQNSFVTIEERETPTVQLPENTANIEIEAPPEVLEEVLPKPDISIDFVALKAVNPDVIGWIYIPNTTISYPVLQGDNNQTYTGMSYDYKYSGAGSIFADYRVDGDFTDLNTVVYGHNMKSGTMFGVLDSYTEAEFAKANPYFFMLTENGYLLYEVCYSFETKNDSLVYDYDFTEEDSFAKHLSDIKQAAEYDADVEISDTDKIVTLSTCTGVVYNERFVVIGKLIED